MPDGFTVDSRQIGEIVEHAEKHASPLVVAIALNRAMKISVRKARNEAAKRAAAQHGVKAATMKKKLKIYASQVEAGVFVSGGEKRGERYAYENWVPLYDPDGRGSKPKPAVRGYTFGRKHVRSAFYNKKWNNYFQSKIDAHGPVAPEAKIVRVVADKPASEMLTGAFPSSLIERTFDDMATRTLRNLDREADRDVYRRRMSNMKNIRQAAEQFAKRTGISAGRVI